MTWFNGRSLCLLVATMIPISIVARSEVTDGSAITHSLTEAVPPRLTTRLGQFNIDISRDSLLVTWEGIGKYPVLELDLTRDWLSLGLMELDVVWNHGSFDFKPRPGLACVPQSRGVVTSSNDQSVVFVWPLSGPTSLCSGRTVTLTLRSVSDHRLDFAIKSDAVGINVYTLTAQSQSDETFHGFGLQPTYLNLKGQDVPVWPQEQGVGRGRQPYSWLVNRAASGSSGSPVTTYMAAPYFITNKHRGLFLKNRDYVEIDLTQSQSLGVRTYGQYAAGEILGGDHPKQLVSAFTEYSGRMRRAPDWFHSGAIVGLQGGTERVRQILRKIQALGTPLAGLWLQDWVGQRRTWFGQQLWWNWELDEQHYPQWDHLLSDLRSQGVRLLGYVNPHLARSLREHKKPTNGQRNLYEEASVHGYLVKNQSGGDYAIRLGAIESGMVDLANPAARVWIKSVIKDQVIARGFSGWMCDFSESLPPDSQLYGGHTGREFHNDYIEEWARVNREAIEEAGIAEDAVYFCRAGFTHSPGTARFFWQGDQTVTWDRFDGLQSALIGLIGGGISGYSLNHSDIGGYTGVSLGNVGVRRSAELLERWQEFSAFTPAFRTHEGLRPEANAQIYDSDNSLAAFDRNARIFASLQFYRKQLFAEAESLGHPVVRAMFLEFPDYPQAYNIDDQFMLGSEILVAPVVNSKQHTREVQLPAGTWVHVWTGQTYGDPSVASRVIVNAPLGAPPAFYRTGSAVGAEWIKRLAELGVKKR